MFVDAAVQTFVGITNKNAFYGHRIQPRQLELQAFDPGADDEADVLDHTTAAMKG